jgi:hypothetical protein
VSAAAATASGSSTSSKRSRRTKSFKPPLCTSTRCHRGRGVREAALRRLPRGTDGSEAGVVARRGERQAGER